MLLDRRGLVLSLLCVVCGWSLPGGVARGESPQLAKKVLILGIDGCRFDAVRVAETPNLNELIKDGALDEGTLILGERYQKNDTVSGPGWSSILTGVWADKHGTQDNDFRTPNYKAYPHFFDRLKTNAPKANTVSIVDWLPIYQYIVSKADVSLFFPPADEYRLGDELITRAAVDSLTKSNPTAMFVYLGQVDETGHKHGFHPTVPEYIAAINRTDRYVGMILAAMRKRASFAKEDWLVIVTTDHGGKDKGHGGGHKTPEILHSFMIVSGGSATRGKLPQTYLVDVVPTALTHLGVPIDPAWKLDGQSVGLQK